MINFPAWNIINLVFTERLPWLGTPPPLHLQKSTSTSHPLLLLPFGKSLAKLLRIFRRQVLSQCMSTVSCELGNGKWKMGIQFGFSHFSLRCRRLRQANRRWKNTLYHLRGHAAPHSGSFKFITQKQTLRLAKSGSLIDHKSG